MTQKRFPPVKICVFGLGRFGRLHALTLARLAEAGVVALVARRQASLDTLAPFFLGVKGQGTFDEAAHKKALQPMGQWSTTEVTCKADGTVSVKLNGTPVAAGKSELTSGPIGFQSEGFEVHFRNIKIKAMK